MGQSCDDPMRFQINTLSQHLLKFGNLARKYVLLHPKSKESDSEDCCMSCFIVQGSNLCCGPSLQRAGGWRAFRARVQTE